MQDGRMEQTSTQPPWRPRAGFITLMLLGFALVVLVRMPQILAQGGRFWAEEGVVYFANSWNWPWYQAWFAIHTGYINFIAGFGTWLGLQLGGLDHAPLVTVLLALLVQALAPFIILTHDFPWRRSRLACASAVLLCAVPPGTAEVWLNTITSQFHLGLAAALILAAPPKTKPLFVLDALLLAVGVLSGPATSFLLPLFLLRGVLTRSRVMLLFSLILLAGFGLQLGIYLTHPVPARSGQASLATLLAVIALHGPVMAFTGMHGAAVIGRCFLALHQAQALLWPPVLILVLFYALLGWLVAGARFGRATLALLLAAQIVILFVSFDKALSPDFTDSMGAGWGGRYAFIPLVLTGLILTGAVCATSWARRAVAFFALLLVLVVGVTNDRTGTANFANGPAWGPQAKAWQVRHWNMFKIWPGTTGWIVALGHR